MTVFLINDAIFRRLGQAEGVNTEALKNLVAGINKDPEINLAMTRAIERGDLVVRVAQGAELASLNAGAAFDYSTLGVSNDGKMAILVDPTWLVGSSAALASTSPGTRASAINVFAHEVDHYMRVEKFKAIDRYQDPGYLPSLTGEARFERYATERMQTEVQGWYAGLRAFRVSLTGDNVGKISETDAFRLTAMERLLLGVEMQGRQRGLTGSSLEAFVGEKGAAVLSRNSDYWGTYVSAMSRIEGINAEATRQRLAYRLDQPDDVLSWNERGGGNVPIVSTVIYRDGSRVEQTRNFDLSGQALRFDQAGRLVEKLTSTTSQNGTRTVENEGPRGEILFTEYTQTFDDGSSIVQIMNFSSHSQSEIVTSADGSIHSSFVVRVTEYLHGTSEPNRIEVDQSNSDGHRAAVYVIDSNGRWIPVSWIQDGQTFTGDDLGAFIANLENSSNANDAASSQTSTTTRLNQALGTASGENVAGVASALNTGASTDTLANRLGIPYVSNHWAPAFLSGQVSPQLLLLNTAGALTNQGLASIAQLRINTLQNQPSIFTVRVVGGGFSLPLTLDLGDDGLDLVSVDRSNASFDVNATGTPQTVGWVGPKDGILILDKNGNGLVDSAAEWFGQKFTTSGAPPSNQDGFKALATLANAGATALSASTSRVNAATGKRYFDELQVWVDADQDGKTDAGELRSLASLGITSIDLSPRAVNREVNGNTILSEAGYTTADGVRHTVSDVGLSTELPVLGGGLRPVSAAALAFADYASKGYAAMATGQAKAISASVQGLPAGEQAAISALSAKFGLSPTAGPLSQEALEYKAKLNWAAQAGLPNSGLNNKIAYFVGASGSDRAFIPSAQRRINTAPTDIIDVLGGIGALRSLEVSTANSIAAAGTSQSDAQTKAQVANATQNESAREGARSAAISTGSAWNIALMGYLDVKDRMDSMAARLPAIQAKLNELVPQNLNLTGHLSNGATFLTRSDATLAAEAFRAFSAILQPLAALKVTGDQMLSAIAQSNGYTRAYIGQSGQSITVENGYNLLIGNRGSQTFVLGAGVDNIAVTELTGDITVSGFQVGANGDRIQFLLNGWGSAEIWSDGSGNTVVTQNGKKVTLLGVDPAALNLFSNISGVSGVSFASAAAGVRSLEGVEIYDGQTHVIYVSASRHGDILIGGERGSSLIGNSGNDTFIVKGQQYLIEGWGGLDTVSYAQMSMGISLHQVDVSERDDDQRIIVLRGTDNLGNNLRDVSNVIGSSFNDVIRIEGINNNTITGGKGNDVLAGGGGSDTYVFAWGDGADTIEEVTDLSHELDIIKFSDGISASGTSVTRHGEDLVLRYGGSDSITVKRWFAANPQSIEEVRFTDGTTWNRAKILTLLNAPVVQKPLAAQNAIEDTVWTFIIPADTFVAKDGAVLSLSARLANGNALPSWLTFNAATRTFTGTPLNAHVGELMLQVIATDPAGNNVSASLGIAVANTNDAPTVNVLATEQTTRTGAQWIYVIPANLFTDVDVGDHLNYSIKRSDGSDLPAWLHFDAASRTLSGKAGSTDAGILDLKIFVTDGPGASASQIFRLTVADPVAGQQFIGTAGNDNLVGTAGDDTLDGKQGADNMTGGAGNDTYYVDNPSDRVFESENAGEDTVILSLTNSYYQMPDNVENLVVMKGGTSKRSFEAVGNKLNNVIEFVEADVPSRNYYISGGDGNDTIRVRSGSWNDLYGNAGDDILEGGSESDNLTGGSGSDTFLFGRGSGSDFIMSDSFENTGDIDTVQFGQGIAIDQLWFRQNGQFLEVNVIGTNDKISTNLHNVEVFRTNDGKVLLDSQVQNLVQAMAAFSPPPAGQTTLTPELRASLAPVLAANWH